MKPKHTEGPWQITRPVVNGETKLGIAGPYEPDKGNGPMAISIATIENQLRPEGKANAKLISSAPDLLEALQQCITDENATCFRTSEERRIGFLTRRLNYITTLAKEAIAKATL